MDKNICALMRSDTRTVHVSFDTSIDETRRTAEKSYTYVTDLNLSPGDLVVVVAQDSMKLVTVMEVHDGVEIEPNSAISYKWVVAKVDLSHYEKTAALNEKIMEAVSAAYKANLRRSFSEQILLGMPEDQRLAVGELLTKRID
jgi:hypothetical protein